MQDPGTPISPAQTNYYHPHRRTRWWVPFLIIALIIVFFVAILVSILGSIGQLFETEPFEVKSNSVLTINFNRQLEEYSAFGFESLFSSVTDVNFYDMLKAIERAATDDKIKGLYLRCYGTAQIGFAKRMEIIDALERFKSSGKFIYSYIEMGSENDYLLALPSDKIFLAREGVLEMNGYGVSTLFLKGLFEKLGIEYYVRQFEDFKSAGETFSRIKYSDSARFAIKQILEQRYNSLVNLISKYRKINPDELNKIFDRGVYSADSLLAYGFVDSLLNENQVKNFIRGVVLKRNIEIDTTKEKVNFITLSNYISSENFTDLAKVDKENAIAIVYASGPIMQRYDSDDFIQGLQITPDAFIRNLKKARDDKKVKAIIIRVDSPGGSVIASDEIYEEIRKTKKIKPVYASMSDVAASGGYYISIACDTIIAHPSTITGSIGVISMVPNFSKLTKMVGVSVDTISTNIASQDLNLFLPFSENQLKKLDELMRPIYYRFIQKVAESRKKSFEETRALAKGRVWTGEQAYQRGLVDVLGGLDDAIKLASKRIGVPNPAIKRFPRPSRDKFEMLLKFLKDTPEESTNKFSFDTDGMQYLKLIINIFPADIRAEIIKQFLLIQFSTSERIFYLMPNVFWIN